LSLNSCDEVNDRNKPLAYGFMPAKATIFTASKCEPKYQLGAGPHNTVRWNPWGRFVCLAGFGNLPGDMKFFDRKTDGKYKLVGATRAACAVTAEWSPDGRRLLTATTAPRLNVDNGFKIWRYNGDLLHHSEREKLYEAKWQPAVGLHKFNPLDL
jgi:translation initiation factor 2A